MNVKKLEEKLTQLRSAAELKSADANKALQEDDYELAETNRNEASELLDKADAVKAQLDQAKRVKSLKPEKDPVRLPFDEGEGEDTLEEDSEKATEKAIHVLRYGKNADADVEIVATELFGSDYYDKRLKQRRAFAKYLRHGTARGKMPADEEALLYQLIYTPSVIKSEIQAGYSISEIQANKVVQQEASIELGGALVPEDWRGEIIKRIMGLTVVRPRARIVTTARDAVEWPKLEGGDSRFTSGVRVTWVDEVPVSATESQTNFTLGTIKVPVHTVMTRTDVSKNLLEDSAVDIVDLVSELFSEAMAIDEDEQFLVGIGGGRPEGVLGNRSGAEKTPVSGIGEKVSGQAAALTADGLIDLTFELDVQYMQNAILVGAKNTFREIRKLKDGVSDYLWQRGIEKGAPPTVLDWDWFTSEAMPAVAANAYPLIFGDWKGYLIADRVGMAIQRVEDVTTAGQNKIALFARRRLGGQVIQPYRFKVQKVSA